MSNKFLKYLALSEVQTSLQHLYRTFQSYYFLQQYALNKNFGRAAQLLKGGKLSNIFRLHSRNGLKMKNVVKTENEDKTIFLRYVA